MNIDHPCRTSPVFEHVGLYEFDLEFGDDLFPTRVELLRDVNVPTHYRARIWQLEIYRVQSTFPQDEGTGEPLDAPSDENLLVERSPFSGGRLDSFTAASDEEATTRVATEIEGFLQHVFGSSAGDGDGDADDGQDDTATGETVD